MQVAHQGDPTLHYVPLWVTDARNYCFVGIISLMQKSISVHNILTTEITEYTKYQHNDYHEKTLSSRDADLSRLKQ